MSCVASVLVGDRTVTVALSVTEKIEALHGDLAVPRTAVVRARSVPDGLAEVHGPDLPTGWPASSTVGTVQDFAQNFDRVTFAVCHGRQPALVLDLVGQPYDRIVVTTGNPGQLVSRLT
jgi:putative intracellular protease/amidase